MNRIGSVVSTNQPIGYESEVELWSNIGSEGIFSFEVTCGEIQKPPGLNYQWKDPTHSYAWLNKEQLRELRDLINKALEE